MKYNKKFIVEEGIHTIGLRGIYFSVEDVCNSDRNDEFEEYKKEIIEGILASEKVLGENNYKQDKILQGFRLLHESVGAPNRKNLSAAENLYRLLLKNGDIPHINLLVDLYNTISVKYKLALGAHDLANTEGNIHLRFTHGDEKFIPLGENEPKPVKAGEYSYIDDSNEIICYLDVRQIDKTKVTLNTTDSFFVVQGNSATSLPYLRQATHELIGLIKKYCGGKAYLLAEVDFQSEAVLKD
jgi:DNA/RNA-binding domain of Phe-tRNA-synthetase-like protein